MIRLRDGEMAALEFGDPNRPIDVVFSHANGFNAQTYRAALQPLDDLRILAVDLRGHGASRLPADAHRYRRSWSILRDDLVEVMDTIAREQPSGPPMVMAGHSMGAIVSLLAADRRSDLVKAAVLLEPVILPHWASLYAALPWVSGGTWRNIPLAVGARRRRRQFDSVELALSSYRGRGAFKTWPEATLQDYVAAGFRPSTDGGVELACDPDWEAANYAAQANDTWGALRRLQRPITLYRAEHNSSCHASSTALARRNALLRIVPVSGTSHFLPMERPQIVQAALREAVAS